MSTPHACPTRSLMRISLWRSGRAKLSRPSNRSLLLRKFQLNLRVQIVPISHFLKMRQVNSYRANLVSQSGFNASAKTGKSSFILLS